MTKNIDYQYNMVAENPHSTVVAKYPPEQIGEALDKRSEGNIRPMHKKRGRVMKEIPKFKTESEERTFWEENDSSDYLDWRKAERAIFPSLKPTTDML